MGVSQSKYDRNYYLTNCDGYTQDGSLCGRLQTILSHIPNWSGMTVFDIGCGRGEVTKHLISLGANVISTDYSYAAFDLFKDNNTDREVFIRTDVTNGFDWIKDSYFDVIVLADIVEHLYNNQLSILGKEASRMTKSCGIILIDTPIMNGGESELHVDIKESAQEVQKYFPNTKIFNTHWYKKPEHCNIILYKL